MLLLFEPFLYRQIYEVKFGEMYSGSQHIEFNCQKPLLRFYAAHIALNKCLYSWWQGSCWVTRKIFVFHCSLWSDLALTYLHLLRLAVAELPENHVFPYSVLLPLMVFILKSHTWPSSVSSTCENPAHSLTVYWGKLLSCFLNSWSKCFFSYWVLEL